MRNLRLISFLLICIFVVVAFSACLAPGVENKPPAPKPSEPNVKIVEGGSYSKLEEVALYIYTFKKLPRNFITKQKAEALGWNSAKGNLWDVTDRMSIGGDVFGNREGRLPNARNRKWYECDVNYNGGLRGGERIVYSNDGLVYYTADHYETFRKLY